MDWEAEKAIIATVAPTLGVAISGPLTSLALSFVSTALELGPSGSVADVVTVLQHVTIEQLRALQVADRTFQKQIKTLRILPRQLNAQQLADDDAIYQHLWFPEVFALVICILFFLLLTFFAWHPIPDGPNATVLNVMLGAVAASFTSVVSYFFGSTRASGRKDLMLYNSKPV